LIAEETPRNSPWNLPTGVKCLPVNDYPMAYMEGGKGPTVILVHGALADYRYWAPELVSLSAKMRIVTVSLRHHFPERWDGKDGDYSITTHTADLARFIEGLDCGPVDLVGHSRGGAVAAMTAVKRPDLVRKLVLAEPAILSLLPQAADGNEARVAQIKHLNERLDKGDTEGALEFFIDAVNAPGTWKSRPEPFRQIARDNVWTISRQATDIESMGVAGVASLKMPVLLIGGDKSPRMFTGILDALNQALPSATRETLPDAGHQLSRDNQAAFDRALTGFLSK
jgi:pimeloyl-ACP methyl ester carboxylesterase